MTTHSFSLLTTAFTHTHRRVCVCVRICSTISRQIRAHRPTVPHQIQAYRAMPRQTTHCLMTAAAAAVVAMAVSMTRLFAIRHI